MDEGLVPLSLTQGDSGQWTLQSGWQVTLGTPSYPCTNGWSCISGLHGMGLCLDITPEGTSACVASLGLAQVAMMLAERSPEERAPAR